MKRATIFLYGVLCYLVFFISFLYAVGFIGNLWVPKTIDSGRDVPLGFALAFDLCLIGVFAIQHSVMARPWFKERWTRLIPEAAERSTYVLASSLLLIVIFALWQPIGGVVWRVESHAGSVAMYVAYAFGWTVLLLSSFLINHFDLFGLRQVYFALRNRPCPPLNFEMPFLYRLVRHPLYVGWLFIVWSTPTMTIAHLVFALASTGYILIGIQLEEHDLIAAHPEYETYRRKVPMLIPFMKKPFEQLK